MGGFGSNRWNWTRTRQTTDPLLWLDVRLLARQGALVPGTVATTNWTTNGEPSGWVSHRAEMDALTLVYQTRRPRETDWQPVRERIPLVHTPCHYGGTRPWFICPGCGTRRAILHSDDGRFRCRRCHDLAYASTREEPLYRLNRRGEKVMAKLGTKREWVLNWYFPPAKPKGMHWRTYERLWDEWQAIRRAANSVYRADLLRLIESTDRLLADRARDTG